MTLAEVPWGTVAGQAVTLDTLTNVNGLIARITNYGGTAKSCR